MIFNAPRIAPGAGEADGPANVRFSNASEGTGEIYLYDHIGAGFFGGIGADDFARGLKELGNVDRIRLYINSEGGDVFQGFAIANQLRRHSAQIDVIVDGLAASIASVIAMAGDSITMADNAWFMIHNVWGFAGGEADDFRKAADRLDELGDTIATQYANRTGQDVAQIREWMSAETWMNAETSEARGFTDHIEPAIAELAASVNPKWFANAPEAVLAAAPMPDARRGRTMGPDEADRVARQFSARAAQMRCVMRERGLG